MNILNYIYNIFIGSLEYVFDFVFTIAYYITNSAGLSIIALSIFVNLIMMPIRKKADEMSKEEKDKQTSLKPWVDKIKKAFKGDEQYMILQTYYRQNNYKPIYSLKSSISLIIQIPFFIAAYHYLNNSYAIDGASFLFIDNLSVADGLLFGFNLFPILMTIISIVSNIVFTKGSSFKDNYQLYLLSALFLVILYDAPSGLVMYYLLNNTFSLIKSLIEKIPNNKKVIKILLFIIGCLGTLFAIVKPQQTLKRELVVLTFCIILMMPLLIKRNFDFKNNINLNNRELFLVEIVIILILGLFIPSNVIESSPTDFAGSSLMESPNNYVYATFFIALGLFGFWINVLVFLTNKKIQKAISILFSISAFVAIVNYMLFGQDMGIISNTLVYQNEFSFTKIEMLLNLIIDIIIIAIVYLLLLKNKEFFKKISYVTIIVLLLISFINIRKTDVIINESYERINSQKNNIDNIKVSLSNEKENVIIIVLDKAISSFFPYIIEENKEISEAFCDFTYYPNTISFGGATVLGSPAMYGGYEYTTYKMNKVDERKLVDIHNEALMVMPVLFSNNGYDVTIFDQQFANYENVPDFSIYDDYDSISAFNAEGKFSVDNCDFEDTKNKKLDKLLLSFSITKSMPEVLFDYFYNDGIYNSTNNYFENYDNENIYISHYLNSRFYDSYAVLANLPSLVEINNSNNCFFILHNLATHEPQLLQLPNYDISINVNNSKYPNYNIKNDANNNILELEAGDQLNHYCVNYSALKQMASFINYLKENSLYDNSRIIVVSDHGYKLKLSENMIVDGNDKNLLTKINPLLLVKDFNVSKDEISIDNSFMSNADVPNLATFDLIDNAINPFSGLPLDNDYKKQEQIITFSADNIADKDIYSKDIKEWYCIKDNIFDLNKWHLLEE